MTQQNNTNTLKLRWHKMTKNAVIPAKKQENAGFDIYTILTDDFILHAGETRMFATGLQVSISEGYYLQAFDRGSTGSIGLHTHCGVIDTGYRGEIFIALSNTNSETDIKFTKSVDKVCQEEGVNLFYYPLTKAIAQLVPIAMPQVDSAEVSDNDWFDLMHRETEQGKFSRGSGKLGSSGK